MDTKTNITVNISADVRRLKMERKRRNKRKWREMQKYIPFLKYISRNDASGQTKYSTLLHWLQTKNEFPAHMANSCENTVKMKYEKLKSSVVFPSYIVNVFKKPESVVISDDDNEPIKLISDTPSNSNKLSNASILEASKIIDKSKKIAEVNKPEKNIQNNDKTNISELSLLKSNNRTSKKVNINSTLTNPTQSEQPSKAACSKNDKSIITIDVDTVFEAVLEEGEILSDKESTSPPHCSHNRIKPKLIDDDAINKELFSRIDSITNDVGELRGNGALSWKDLEKEDERQLSQGEKESQRRPSQLSISLSSISDEVESNNVSHKKKKKKRKHKKKTQAENYLERKEKENTQVKNTRRDSWITDDEAKQIKNLKKQKKSAKKQKQKQKPSRLLFVSDDEEEQNINSVNSVQTHTPKIIESELFRRRDFPQKNNIATKETKKCVVDTVVLLDSEEEIDNSCPAIIETVNNCPAIVETVNSCSAIVETVNSCPAIVETGNNCPAIVETVNNCPAIFAKSGKTFLIDTDEPSHQKITTSVTISKPKLSQNLNSPISPSSAGALFSNVTQVQNQTNKLPSNTNELQDLNNMDLQELSDIYSQLCEKTGIQLEAVLSDLVNKSAVATNQMASKMGEEPISQTNISQYTNNNIISNHNDLYNHALDQQYQYQQQQQQLPLQPQLQQTQLVMPSQANQMQCGLPGSNPYHNSLRSGLNLNDPRIVKKLKQIKDSPIHNVSIRESANFLMTCFTSRCQNLSTHIPEVTSKTVRTYGEHKRLRELEKQKRLELQEAKKRSEIQVTNGVPNLTESTQNHNISRSTTIVKPSQPLENKPKQDTSFKSINVRKASCSSEIESSISSEGNVSLQNSTSPKEKDTFGNMTPFERERVVDIVLSAMGETTGTTNNKTKILSKLASRRNSIRMSVDSTKSDPKPIYNEQVKKIVENDPCMFNEESPTKYSETKKKKRGNSCATPTEQNDEKRVKIARPKTSLSKRCRELDNLNCTFLDYKQMFEKNWLLTIDGKRRCSVLPEANREHQLDTSDGDSKKSTKSLSFRRTSNAINESLHELDKPAPIQRRRQTCSALQKQQVETTNTLPPLKVVIRRLSETGTFGVEGVKGDDKNSSDDTDEFDIEEHRKTKTKPESFEHPVKVKLKKLSISDIKKSLSSTDDNVQQECLASNSSDLSVWKAETQMEHKADQSTLLLKKKSTSLSPRTSKKVCQTSIVSEEIPILVPYTSKPVETPANPVAKFSKHINVNINMTPASTKLCAICNKRPLDLTNHYVLQHKTESFISRLTSAEIKNLEENIRLAVPYRKRYKVECAFCQDELEDQFVNFHAHYSYHTGEYGFRCDVCELVKPYREDIRSHQHRARRCRNSKIRTNYLYSPDLTVIYLYVCTLCNFVQLNEANVHKHQRDHHGFMFDEPQHVKKCIIAAADSTEVINEVLPANLEDDSFKVHNSTADGNLMGQEQEFLHECPLDIKDVLLIHENQANQNDKQIPEPTPLEGQQKQIINSSNLAPFENLPKDIFIDSSLIDSNAVASPEDLLAQLHGPETSSNIITVIHCADSVPFKEHHKPYMEAIDQKPIIEEILIDTPPSESKQQQIKHQMIYRKVNSNRNYFGLYKCSLENCWFSTNVAESFIKHMNTHPSQDLNIPLNCAYCPVKGSTAEKLVRHVRSRHSMSRYQCSDCSYRSIISENVTIHQEICHEDSTEVKCIYECTGRVRKMEDKMNAMKKKMLENVTGLKCPDCSSRYYALSAIKLHIQIMHPRSFDSLDWKMFYQFACIYCKTESSSKKFMQIHLATEHPDEMCYVLERKLKDSTIMDAIENLEMINIGQITLSANIQQAFFEECKTIDSVPELFQDANSAAPMDIAYSTPTKTSKSVESTSISQLPDESITIEEKLVLDRIKPLLEVLTENTGVNHSTLYRCPECHASFFNYDLWLSHIKNRHNITETVACPYCSKSLTLNLVAGHFKIHSRHTFVCFHCITSFYSREKIQEHFRACHSDSKEYTEKPIPCGLFSFYIVKKQDVPFVDWVLLLQNFDKAIHQNLTERLQQNTRYEWWGGISPTCFEEMELPQYIKYKDVRYKCFRRSCSFVGLDEDSFDLHLKTHSLSSNYKCSECGLVLNALNWEHVKAHKMLHMNDLHICCVCKFVHHNRSGIIKHIENKHNSRDVPVINIWRNESNYKTSLAIVLPPRKTNFTTSVACFCCGIDIKNCPSFVLHLRTEHNISLCPKCQLCDKIVLTQVEAEIHAAEHGMDVFKLKFDVLTTFLYNLVVKSMSPFAIETRASKEKRPLDDVAAPALKRGRLEEEPVIKVKEEIVIKTEHEEYEIRENANSNEMTGGSIKCVNIDQLVVKEPLITTNLQDISKRLNHGAIHVKPTAALQMTNLVPISKTVTPQGVQKGCCVASTTAKGLNENYNDQIIQPSSSGQMMPTSGNQYSSPVAQASLHARNGQYIINIPLLNNNKGTAVISRPPNSHPATNTVFPPIVCLTGINNSSGHNLSQNVQLHPSSVISQTESNPIHHSSLTDILPICMHCKIECTDFPHLITHFEAEHAPHKKRFMFYMTRKIQCMHCSFRGSLASLPAHNNTFHPDKQSLCRSISNPNVCGVCYGAFTEVYRCLCPTRKQNYLDLQTLKTLQSIGKMSNGFLCDLCKKIFHYHEECVRHILTTHHRSRILPKQCPIKCMMYLCNSCEKAEINIEELIKHIRYTHYSGILKGTLADRIKYYRKIKVAYPLGFIVSISNLLETGLLHEESFKQNIISVEADYIG